MEEGGIKSRNSRNSTRGHIWGRHRKMSWIWMCGEGGGNWWRIFQAKGTGWGFGKRSGRIILRSSI